MVRLRAFFTQVPWGQVLRILSNRYVLGILVFALWVSFFDANSVVNILSARRRVSALEAKRQYYEQRIAEDRERLHDLQTSRVSLERFAREQYYMRRPNEDVFVVE